MYKTLTEDCDIPLGTEVIYNAFEETEQYFLHRGAQVRQPLRSRLDDVNDAFLLWFGPDKLREWDEPEEVVYKIVRKMYYLNYATDSITTAVRQILRDYHVTDWEGGSLGTEELLIDMLENDDKGFLLELGPDRHDVYYTYVSEILYDLIDEPLKASVYSYASDYANVLLEKLDCEIRTFYAGRCFITRGRECYEKLPKFCGSM